MQNSHARTLPRRTASLLNGLAKATGVRIELVDSIRDAAGNEDASNGLYIPASNTIQISMKANNSLAAVAAHEITHRMQELAPELGNTGTTP